jgi:hypothetical protein
VKIAGQWVQPDELEEAVADEPAIAEVACVPVTDAEGFERLALFVAAAGDAAHALAAAGQACERRLPRFKQPKWIRSVAELPRTATGQGAALQAARAARARARRQGLGLQFLPAPVYNPAFTLWRRRSMRVLRNVLAALSLCAIALAPAAYAQTIKIGLINTYSGPMASNGDQIQKAVDLYMKLNESKLPAGVKLEIIKRDDTGINPETAKRLAQELIVRDKVNLITGVIWTPNAAAIAPLATEAKVPVHHHERRHRDADHALALHRADLVHAVAVELSDGHLVVEEIQDGLTSRSPTMVPGTTRRPASPRASPTAAAKSSARFACHRRPRTSRPSCSVSRMRSRRRCSCSCPPASRRRRS